MDIILANFHFVLLILALFLGAFKWTGESFCRYMLLLPVGIGGLYGFILHVFASDYTARKLGWTSSPFQYQVGAANLGLGLAGILAFWKSWEFALAVTVMTVGFVMGSGFLHIFEGLFDEDYKIGNIGVSLYTDLLMPALLTLVLCYWYQEKRRRETRYH